MPRKAQDQELDITVRLETKRAQIRARRKALVTQGPETALSAKSRGPQEFLQSLRANLDPAIIGPMMSQLFIDAMAVKNIGLLKLLLPYVLGAPPEVDNQTTGSLDMLLAAMRSPAPPRIEHDSQTIEGEVTSHE